MKVLCIGDPHIKKTNIPRSKEMIDSILAVARERKPDIIVDMGDTLDRHGDIRVEPLTTAVDFLGNLSDIAELYVIIGNHDLPNNSCFQSDQHPFTALRRWKNTTVVDHAIVKGEFSFCPYVPPGRLIEALDTAPGWKDTRVLFCHQEFRHCSMGKVKHGDIWNQSLPRVFSGHIHKYGVHENITYVGTPIQESFGDDDLKTISLLTIGEEITEERIELKIPRMLRFKITTGEVATYVLPEKGLIKVEVTGTPTDVAIAKKGKIISDWIDRGVKMTYKYVDDVTVLKIHTLHTKTAAFRDRFIDSIKDDDRLMTEFTRLFPT